MSDTFIQLNTDGTGKKLDTRTEATNGEHRQVFVIGDPATNAGVAPVDATKGLAVDLTATGTNSNPLSVTGTFFQATQPVSLATNTPTLQSGSTTAVTQATGTNLHAVIDSGSTTAVTQPTAANLNATVVNAAGSALMGKVGIDQTTPGTTNAVSVTNTTLAVTESGTWNVGASSATGSAVPANAFYQGVNPQTALPTAATAGNLTGATADKFGRQVVIPGTVRDLVGSQTTTITASTTETTIVTAAASTFNDITTLLVNNTSATAVRVDFRDTTAGTILFALYIPAGDVRGFCPPRPLPQTAVNTNWTAQCSASVTDVRIYAVFDKNK